MTKWEEFSAEMDYIRGSTNSPLSYLLRNTLIPKDEDDDDEDDYATIDHQMIQRAQIIKTAFITMNEDELEEDGPTKKTAAAKIGNMTLYDLENKKFCATAMWAHTKSCARDRDGRRAMLAMMINSQGANAIENRYSENQYKIRNTFYHGGEVPLGNQR